MSTFDDVYSAEEPYYGQPSAPLAKFTENMDLRNARGVDLGAGDGRNAFLLASKGAHVDAYDISAVGVARMDREARSRDLPLSAHQADLTGVVLAERSIDFAVASTVLDHLSPTQSHAMMDKIWSWLKLGGWFYVSVFTESDPSYSPSNGTASDTAQFIVTHYRSQELLNRLLALHGFIAFYSEGIESDSSHGKPHHHGIARAIATKVEIGVV